MLAVILNQPLSLKKYANVNSSIAATMIVHKKKQILTWFSVTARGYISMAYGKQKL
jgi:hypothetical protein